MCRCLLYAVIQASNKTFSGNKAHGRMKTFLYFVLTLIGSTQTVEMGDTVQKHEQIADTYYQKCPLHRRCDGSRVDHDDDYILSPQVGPCCDECSCEDDCVETLTCCPDKLALLKQNNEYQSTNILTCTAPLLKRRHRGYKNGILTIQSCSKSFTNETIKQLCSDFPSTTLTNVSLNESGLVTDKRWQNTTYYNIYCALCNGLSKNEVLFWFPTTLECEKGYFLPADEEDLLKRIWTTKCNVEYYPPYGTSVKTCDAFISQCNITGLWRKYDRFVEEACHSFIAEYNITYQNVFCYECNEIIEPPYVCQGIYEINVFPVSFSAILNFMASENSEDSIVTVSDECQSGHVYDSFQMKCIKLHCYFGGRYYNGTCMQGFIGSSWGLEFQTNIKLTPQTKLQQDAASILAEQIHTDIFNVMSSPSELSYEPCRLTLLFEKQNLNVSHILSVRYELKSGNHSYQDKAFVQQMLRLHQTTRNYSHGNESVLFYLELYINTIWDVKTDYIPTTKNKFVIFKDVEFENSVCKSQQYSETTVAMTRALQCPLIELTTKTSMWIFNGENVLLKQPDLLISDIDVLKGLDDLSIFVCADVYFEGVRKIMNTGTRLNVSGPVSPVGYLTFACMIVSVICLTVTILTYLLFPSLLTQPGVNNVILSSVLIASQCLFQFGIGQKENVSHTSCVLIGILVHFFWLFTILWMNVCSIHMARAFRSLKPKVLHDHRIKTSTSYLIYSFILSSFFVILNIVVSRTTSGGNIFGYADGNLCYISNRRMIGFTFALPVGMVVLINCLLFLQTVYQICTIEEIPKANKKSRNFLIIYIRLSTITGLTWVFGFFYILSSVEIFEYVFAILNSGQGIFIMLAFVMNKRVLGMYRAKLLKESTVVTETTNQTKDNNLDITDN